MLLSDGHLDDSADLRGSERLAEGDHPNASDDDCPEDEPHLQETVSSRTLNQVRRTFVNQSKEQDREVSAGVASTFAAAASIPIIVASTSTAAASTSTAASVSVAPLVCCAEIIADGL